MHLRHSFIYLLHTGHYVTGVANVERVKCTIANQLHYTGSFQENACYNMFRERCKFIMQYSLAVPVSMMYI